MAPASTVQTSTPARTCPDCHRPIDGLRRYCDRDRDRRRALTFLRQAHQLVGQIDDQTTGRLAGAIAAREHIVQAMEELGG